MYYNILFRRAPRRFCCTTTFCSFPRRDDFVVGQDGILRPIVNRPNAANSQHSSFASCRHAEQNTQSAAGCQPNATRRLVTPAVFAAGAFLNSMTARTTGGQDRRRYQDRRFEKQVALG
jgi:hypothetical protein